MTVLDDFYFKLQVASGISRLKHPDLEREAAERAVEARAQVGLDGTAPISHPTQAEREARLGPEWANRGVVELATWNYRYHEPVQAAVDGLIGSAIHRDILVDPRYRYWGLAHYSEFPSGVTEPLEERHYFIVWLSVEVPTVADPFNDIAGSQFREDIINGFESGYLKGTPDPANPGELKFRPDDTVTRGEMAAFLWRLHEIVDP